jgi:hypothetical protein
MTMDIVSAAADKLETSQCQAYIIFVSDVSSQRSLYYYAWLYCHYLSSESRSTDTPRIMTMEIQCRQIGQAKGLALVIIVFDT